MIDETAVFVVNRKLQNDRVLNDIFSPHPVIAQPGVANEPLAGEKSYPYLRYFYVPVISRATTLLRRDTVQYVVGAKDLTVIARAIERIIYILNTPDYTGTDEFAAPDVNGKYKIMDIIVTSGTPQVVPSQDEGVWEQGVNLTMIYSIVSPGWGTTEKTKYSTDSLLN